MNTCDTFSVPQRARGSVMVEFTLIVPLLVALLLGAVFFGRDIHTYNRLEESVRMGARFAAMQRYDANSGADPAPTKCASCTFAVTTGTFATRIKNVVAYGCEPGTSSSTGCTDLPVVESVSPANVNVVLNIVNWVPVSVRVSVTNITMPTPFGNLTLNDKPGTTFPWVGTYMAPGP